MTPGANGTTQPVTTPQPGSTTQPGGTTQPSGTTQANTFDTIVFTITPSGADSGLGGLGGGFNGLGGDSALTATLFQAGASSTPFQTISLKTSSQPAWISFVAQTITVSLTSPVTATSLGSVAIALIPGTEDPNTLEIQSIQVVISNSSGTPVPVMLLNQTGTPFQNLTGNHPSATLPL
jgi:hypothetical protein